MLMPPIHAALLANGEAGPAFTIAVRSTAPPWSRVSSRPRTAVGPGGGGTTAHVLAARRPLRVRPAAAGARRVGPANAVVAGESSMTAATATAALAVAAETSTAAVDAGAVSYADHEV